MVDLACFKRPLQTNEINFVMATKRHVRYSNSGDLPTASIHLQVHFAGPQEGADLLLLPAVTCKCLHGFVDDILTTGYQIVEQRKTLRATGQVCKKYNRSPNARSA